MHRLQPVGLLCCHCPEPRRYFPLLSVNGQISVVEREGRAYIIRARFTSRATRHSEISHGRKVWHLCYNVVLLVWASRNLSPRSYLSLGVRISNHLQRTGVQVISSAEQMSPSRVVTKQKYHSQCQCYGETSMRRIIWPT